MVEPMPHQLMGYDRAITMFSPDGRLLQVEYAKKTVRQGSTAVGMVCSDGVLFVTDKRIVDSLIVPESVEKIWQIDDHMGATASGILSDARVLIERAQLKAQQHRVTYDSPVDVITIVKDIANLKQICTQSGGLRPFGVSVLIAGIDGNTPRLYETDPTGIFFEYKASVIGEGEVDVEEILQKEYKPEITIEAGLNLCLSALKKVLGDNFSLERIDAFVDRLNGITNITDTINNEIETIIDKAHKQFFDDGLLDDLNMSVALASIFDLIREVNILCDKNTVNKDGAFIVLTFFKLCDKVLGIIFTDDKEDIPQDVLELVDKRKEERESKNWSQADILRDKILSKGYIVEDTPQGQKLKKR